MMAKKKGKKCVWIGLLIFGLLPAIASGGTEDTRIYMLFNGAAFDSTDHGSPWIPVRGANRLILRTWTTKSAFGLGTEADSTYSDSLAAFSVLFSDSVSFIARDSCGTLVGASSLIPKTSCHGEPFPVCADSAAIVPTTSPYDTSLCLASIRHAPVNKELRAPVNGSGILSYIFPTGPGSVSAYGDGSFGKNYMRIRATPRRRMTGQCSESTQGKRVNGLKGFRMEAQVIYKNR